MAQTALKYDTAVADNGRVKLYVPFPAGVRITVFVIEEPAEAFTDLLSAAQSSLEFWDNSYDDDFKPTAD